MVRLLFVLLLLAPLAQAQVPDSIPPVRYVPIEVGNEWHYEDWRSQGKPPWPPPPAEHVGYVIHDVVGEQEVDGEICFEVHARRFNLSGGQITSHTGLVRFDDEVENLISCTEQGSIEFYYASPCPLSAPFDSFIDCPDEYYEVEVWGSHGTVEIGDQTVETTMKSFVPAATESYHVIASDIGFTRFGFWNDFMKLVYARVGDQQYGNPFVVSTEPAAPPPGTLSVFPNPASSEAVVRFSFEEPQAARIEVFDLLGRRVMERELGTLTGGEHEVRLDIGSLPAGLYIMRLTGDAGAEAVVRLTRVRLG